MPTLGTYLLPPPSGWSEFEEMCADLFGSEWGDTNVTRYALQGGRQDGVDVYGTLKGKPAGVQCKGRHYWPLKKLKTTDIDAAVAEAKNFKPALARLIIATTAPVGKALQDHARTISATHKAQKLFSVDVFGWSELTRKLTKYDNLVAKHYPLETLGKVQDTLAEVPQLTADLVVERLRE